MSKKRTPENLGPVPTIAWCALGFYTVPFLEALCLSGNELEELPEGIVSLHRNLQKICLNPQLFQHAIYVPLNLLNQKIINSSNRKIDYRSDLHDIAHALVHLPKTKTNFPALFGSAKSPPTSSFLLTFPAATLFTKPWWPSICGKGVVNFSACQSSCSCDVQLAILTQQFRILHLLE
ncbi:hypothetical protein CEXT_692921 [Caerostris extrusa]|uniref:Uncharacterized protein n=1 Tax=Caerostris extrusa TaxID=172846 RepID=A0AAV4UL10_CAEEX|nr:hypothetical protein CEXT_692921 [Caerostris extrusa]